MSGARSWQSGEVAVSCGCLGWHRTGGAKPPLVLVHGLTDNGLCWSRLAAALAVRFDVIMLDARGHGASTRVPDDESVDPVQDLAEAVAGLGLSRAIFAGHSVGARAVAGLAARHPDYAELVILEDPPLLPPFTGEQLALRRAQFRAHVAELQAESEAQLVARCARQSPDWHGSDTPDWAAAKHQVDPRALPEFRTRWQDDFAGITVPTLLIAGVPALGSMVGDRELAQALALAPQMHAARIAGAGHNVRRENFEAYLAAMWQFIDANELP